MVPDPCGVCDQDTQTPDGRVPDTPLLSSLVSHLVKLIVHLRKDLQVLLRTLVLGHWVLLQVRCV